MNASREAKAGKNEGCQMGLENTDLQWRHSGSLLGSLEQSPAQESDLGLESC